MSKDEFRLEELDIGIEDACIITEFWWKMKQYDLVDRVFFDKNIHDAAQLFMFWKSCWVYVGYQDDLMVGAIWFNNFTENSCNIHICSFPGYVAKFAEDEIESLLQRVLDNSENSAYRICGITPYKAILRHFRNFGFSGIEEVNDEYREAQGIERKLYISERWK